MGLHFLGIFVIEGILRLSLIIVSINVLCMHDVVGDTVMW
jgi:hypothetical protein